MERITAFGARSSAHAIWANGRRLARTDFPKFGAHEHLSVCHYAGFGSDWQFAWRLMSSQNIDNFFDIS